jgi:aminopeptidase
MTSAIHHDTRLDALAELCVRIGVSVQPGQELIVSAPIEAQPLVHGVTAEAYRRGAKLVTCLYDDPPTIRARFDHAADETLDYAAGWMSDGIAKALASGAARLFIYGPYPDLLAGVAPERVARMHAALAAATRAEAAFTADLRVNWCAIPFVTSSWARMVYPDIAPEAALQRLRDDVFDVLRIGEEDPVEQWHTHIATLDARRQALQALQLTALRFFGGDTDVVVGLVQGHRWVGGSAIATNGVRTVCNMPTEEIFTCPHRDRIDGHIAVSRPLALGGTIVEDLRLTFRDGRIVEMQASRGKEIIETLLASDEGAARLGEVGLVPSSSRIARKNVLFYNTLLDENAASHVAFGQSYAACIDEESSERSGANQSSLHIDCMLGHAGMNVDGLLPDGGVLPLMRAGEFTPELASVPVPPDRR